MKIWQFPYALTSEWHGQEHFGVLLKIELSTGEIGYSDFHPWPELGDISLKESLTTIRSEKVEPKLARAMELAAFDAQLRAKKRSAFLGLSIPASHYLVHDFLKLDAAKLEQIASDEYRFVKIKLGRNLQQELLHFKQILLNWPMALKLRLDFNGRLEFSKVQAALSSLGKVFSSICDGVEDAFLPTETLPVCRDWPLFLDRNTRSSEDLGQVLKPEIQSSLARDKAFENQSRRIWVTNNLGHPLGHSMALAFAGTWSRDETCGLQGLSSYSKDAWTEQIRYHGPVTLSPKGTGFGFDSLLAKLKWREIL